MATIQRIAPVHARGAVVSTYLTQCYVALSLPVIIAGEAADQFGLGVVTAGYFVALSVLVGSALVLARRLGVPVDDAGASHGAFAIKSGLTKPGLTELAPTAAPAL